MWVPARATVTRLSYCAGSPAQRSLAAGCRPQVQVSHMPESANAVDIPGPSAEMVLFRVFMQAFLQEVSRKRGERVIRAMAERLAREQSLSTILPIRPHAQTEAVRRARQGAAIIFEAYVPHLMDALPPE